MTEPQQHPKLTPQLCFSTTALRDFLRMSRATVDDSINQNLNALITPAAAGFDPTSTSQRSSRPLSRQPIDSISCQTFKDKVLFPTWQARSELLSYCTLVAISPDPSDPEAAVREAQLEKNKEKIVDERLDPYSARFQLLEPRTQLLATLMRQEQSVENIVRTRTWGVVRERCGDDVQDWESALAKWRKDKASP